MSMSPDSFVPAMQNFVQAGQALAQNFLGFLGAQQQAQQAAGSGGMKLAAPDPQQLAALQKAYFDQQLQLWNAMLQQGTDGQGAPVVEPEAGDRRFASPEWQSSPVFDYVRQAYLLNSRFIRELVEALPAEDEKTKDRARFLARGLQKGQEGLGRGRRGRPQVQIRGQPDRAGQGDLIQELRPSR